MAEIPRYVVDSSVVMKWLLEDEELTEPALELLARFHEGNLRLLAPENIRYEVPGAIRTAVIRHRISREQGREALNFFLALPIPTIRASALSLRAYDQAFHYGCSFYDALYLALAETAQIPLIHADNRLRNTLSGRFQRELWIENYLLE